MWQPVHFLLEIMTCGMRVPFSDGPALEADVDAEFGEPGFTGHAVLVPATHLIVLLHPLGEHVLADRLAGRGAVLEGAGLGVERLRQIVALDAFAQVEQAAEVPDALADLENLLVAELALEDVLEHLCDLIRRDRPEIAPDAAELHRAHVLTDEALGRVADDDLLDLGGVDLVGRRRAGEDLVARRVAAHVATAAIARGVAHAHAERTARVVAGKLEALDVVRELGVAVLCGQGPCAQSQVGADALAPGDELGHPDVAIDVAEAHAEVVDAFLGEVHSEADDRTRRDGVEAPLVAELVELHEGVDVVDAAVGTAESDGLVLRALAADFGAGERGTVEVAAGDGALEAGALLDADLLEGLAVEVLRAREAAGRPVPGGHGTRAVHRVDENRRALLVGPEVVFGEHVLLVDAVQVREERLGVAHRDTPGAAHDEGLQVLLAHEGAVTAAPGLVVLVGAHAGPRDALFAGRADGERLGVGVDVPAHGLLDLGGLHAPVLGRRRAELDDVVLDDDHGRLGGLALDDDRVVAGELHLGRERASDIAVVEDPGGRALAAHHQTRGGADAGTGEGAGHEDDGRLGGPRIHLWRDLVPHVTEQQSLAADVLLGPLHVERLDGRGARTQVDPEYFTLVESQCVLLTKCSFPLRVAPRRCPLGGKRWAYRLRHSSQRPEAGQQRRKRHLAGQNAAETALHLAILAGRSGEAARPPRAGAAPSAPSALVCGAPAVPPTLARLRWLIAAGRLRQVPDVLGRLPLAVVVGHGVEQLLEKARREVDAADDDAVHLARLLALVVETHERDRELVVRVADVGEVGVDARHHLGGGVQVDVLLLVLHGASFAGAPGGRAAR